MKVRFKKEPEITGTADKFNTSSPAGEILMYFDDFERMGGADSVYIKDLEVFISRNLKFLIMKKDKQPEWKPVGHWISMSEAFDKKDLITDNYNTCFFEPDNDEEKKRGYRL